MPSNEDRATFVRESMRQSWAARRKSYVQFAAPNTARYGHVLLDLVAPQPGERVLDVATGSGVVAVAAAQRVTSGGSVVATDLTPEWEQTVREQAAEQGVDNLTFRAMGAEALDFPDNSFDVALCQFGLMFVPHPDQALRELRRVLRPGGRLGVVVWSTADRVPCVSISNQLLAHLVEEVPVERRLPDALALGAPGLIERLVTEAGFPAPRVERRTLDYHFEEPALAWQFRVVEGPPAVRDAVARLSADERHRLHEDFVAAFERHRRGAPGGPIVLPSEAIFVTVQA